MNKWYFILVTLASFAAPLSASITGFQADSTARAIYYEQFGDTATGDSNFITNCLFYDGTGFPTALALAQSGTVAAGGCGYQLTYPSLAVTMNTTTDTLGAMENDTKVLVVDTLAYFGILALSDTIREFLYLNVEGPAGIYGQPFDFSSRKLTIKAFPNPFTIGVEIHLGGGKPSKDRIAVYNALGQKVKTLSCRNRDSIIYWDGRSENREAVSSGLYYLVYENKIAKVVKTK